MKRTPLKRSTKPIPKRRAKPRRGPLRCPAYRAWLRDKFCGCGCGRTPCHAAHTQNNGTGSKGPDSGCGPLFWRCHREYDAGRKDFEAKYGVDMKNVAARYWICFQVERDFLAAVALNR